MSSDKLRGWFDAISDRYEVGADTVLAAEYARPDFTEQVDTIRKCMQGADMFDGSDGVSAPGCDGMYIEWVVEHDSNDVLGIEVQVLFSDFPVATYLSRFLDTRMLTTDRDASGNDGAWCVVEAIYEAFCIVKHQVFVAKGLTP